MFSNDGSGFFSSSQLISFTPSGFTGTGEVEFADLNVDGNQDLMTVHKDGLAVYLGDGSGTYSSSPDIAYPTVNPYARIEIEDLNNDPLPDILENSSGYLNFHEGNGDGTFEQPVNIQAGGGDSQRILTTADLNGDGEADFIMQSQNSSDPQLILTGLGNGDGSFSNLQSFSLTLGNTKFSPGIDTGDINGDGNIDVVIPTSLGSLPADNNLTVLLGNGDGTFGSEASYTTGDLIGDADYGFTIGENIIVADFTNDGLDDVVVANYGDNTVSIYQANPDGTLKSPIVLATGGKPVSLAVADVTGNGFQDILSVSHDDGNITVLQNSGLGAPSDLVPEFVVPTSLTSSIVVSREPMATTSLALAKIDISANAKSVIQTVTNQIETVSLKLARLGASARQLDIALELNIKKTDALTSGLGNLVDTDLAKDSALLQALQVKQQLGTKALGIANQTPNMLLTLFKR